jgi:thiol-disulfide isomerase/thioredoxin
MARSIWRVALAVVVLGGAGVLAWGWRLSPGLAGVEGPAAAGEGEDPTAVPAVAAPEFPEGLAWLQGGPHKLADLRGRVTVLHFWTNGCVNCIHNYPTYRAWQEKYEGKDVTLVGVHTPEFAREAPAERVGRKARDNGLKFPIVLDTESRVWKAWGNRYWPSVYLIDRQGRVRYRWEGELHLDTAAGRRFARHIDELLAEKPGRE